MNEYIIPLTISYAAGFLFLPISWIFVRASVYNIKKAHSSISSSTKITDLIIGASAFILMLASFLGIMGFWSNMASKGNELILVEIRKISLLYFFIGMISFGALPRLELVIRKKLKYKK